MCGRFTLRTSPIAAITALFDHAEIDGDDFDTPHYNIAPTQRIAALIDAAAPGDAGHRPILTMLRWGLVPSWAKDKSMAARMINARCETVATKPAFGAAYSRRRCLIPADGYLEWVKVDDAKQPFLMHRPDDGVFFMAGLWETNRHVTGDDSTWRSATILTTSANSVTSAVHDRMPVVVTGDAARAWMAMADVDDLTRVDDRFFDLTPVSRRVNSVAHQDATCLEPLQG